MRWKVTVYSERERRLRQVFAWWPVADGDEVRWLEWVTIFYEYYTDDSMGFCWGRWYWLGCIEAVARLERKTVAEIERLCAKSND